MRIYGKFIIVICSILAAFFAIILMYSFFYIDSSDIVVVGSDGDYSFATFQKINYIYNMFIAQLIAFLLTATTIIAYIAYKEYKLKALKGGDTKLILLTEENDDSKLECLLGNKSSAIIGKYKTGNKEVCFVDNKSLNFDKNIDKYAVVNCANNCWYIECLSSELPKATMALKRGGKQCVYKLEAGQIYKLQPYDIIYLGKDRLRFHESKSPKSIVN